MSISSRVPRCLSRESPGPTAHRSESMGLDFTLASTYTSFLVSKSLLRIVALNLAFGLSCGSTPTPPSTNPDCAGISSARNGSVPRGNSTVQWLTQGNACACWNSSVTLLIDGIIVGNMRCNEQTSALFSIQSGVHTFEASGGGCLVSQSSGTGNFAWTVELSCRTITPSGRPSAVQLP
jgi:hypothetical protein